MENDPRTYAVIGAAMEVHRLLGCGFLETVYQEALELELAARDIPFRAQVQLPIRYKDRVLKTVYRADFVCYDAVIVELKALTQIGPVEKSQVINYLKRRDMRSVCSSTSAVPRCSRSVTFSRLTTHHSNPEL